MAGKARAYQGIAVAQQCEYVLETFRAEGLSAWWATPHDEFALVMDGELEIELFGPAEPPRQHLRSQGRRKPSRDHGMFHDVAERGYEGELCSFNLFAYLSRSHVTWNPSVVSACKDSLFFPITEEYLLPIIHGDDRVEWFVELSGEIPWKIGDRDTGALRARLLMKAGDVAAMPADLRHQGSTPKRAMLLVWENGSPQVLERIPSGRAPTHPTGMIDGYR